MGLKYSYNSSMLEVALTQIGERAVKGMSDKMRTRARKIRDLAREYAPIKTGLLERSIDYVTQRENGRNKYVVYINLDAPATGGKSLGDYATIMHAQLRPYGTAGGKRYFLGILSQAKAASGKKVGGLFLQRAIAEGLKGFGEEMAGIVKSTTRSGVSSVGLNFKRSTAEE